MENGAISFTELVYNFINQNLCITQHQHVHQFVYFPTCTDVFVLRRAMKHLWKDCLFLPGVLSDGLSTVLFKGPQGICKPFVYLLT